MTLFGDALNVRMTVIGSCVAIALFIAMVALRSVYVPASLTIWSTGIAVWSGFATHRPFYILYALLIAAFGAMGTWHLMLIQRFRKEYAAAWTPYEIRPGDLFTVRDGKSYAVVKVLAADRERIHVRQYALRYPERPWTVKSSTLLANKANSGGRGFAHLPLDFAEFAKWDPWLMRNERVTEEELLPVEMWRRLQAVTDV